MRISIVSYNMVLGEIDRYTDSLIDSVVIALVTLAEVVRDIIQSCRRIYIVCLFVYLSSLLFPLMSMRKELQLQ